MLMQRISLLEQEIYKLEQELAALRRRNVELEQQIERYKLQARQQAR